MLEPTYIPLRYASSASARSPDWSRLTDRDQLIGFVEKLTRAGVGPKGQLGKLDALSNAVRYYQLIATPHERTKEMNTE